MAPAKKTTTRPRKVASHRKRGPMHAAIAGGWPGVRALPVALGVVAAVILLVVTRQWLAGISNDSIAYVAAARGVLGGGGLITHLGEPLVSQPPLYPFLLAVAGGIFRCDPLLTAHAVNAILLGCVVWLSAGLFLRHLESPKALAILGVAFLPVAGPLFRVSVMAWSEPLFLLLTLIYLVHIESYAREEKVTSLVAAAVAAALACLTRYIGVAVVLAGAVSIVLLRKGRVKSRVRHLLVFGTITVLPLAAWLARNLSVSGTLFGPRAASGRTLVQNAGAAFTIVGGWYAHGRAAWLLAIFILVVAAVGVLAFLAARTAKSSAKAAAPPPGPMLTFTLVYVVLLVVSATSTAYDELDTRLLIPVFVPATLGLLLLFREAIALVSGHRGGRFVSGLLVAVLIVFLLALPSQTVLHATRYLRGMGWGYGAASWRGSPTVRYVARNRDKMYDHTTYSNAPEALYLLANTRARLSPGGEAAYARIGGRDLARLRGSWPPEGLAYLVWFDTVDRAYLFSEKDLGVVAEIAPATRLDDGTVYTVTRR